MLITLILKMTHGDDPVDDPVYQFSSILQVESWKQEICAWRCKESNLHNKVTKTIKLNQSRLSVIVHKSRSWNA